MTPETLALMVAVAWAVAATLGLVAARRELRLIRMQFRALMVLRLRDRP